jgi:hypothetical protein
VKSLVFEYIPFLPAEVLHEVRSGVFFPQNLLPVQCLMEGVFAV